jgi:hypothetical protein
MAEYHVEAAAGDGGEAEDLGTLERTLENVAYENNGKEA